jgi:predicted TIM-barrel fold metal-dependent hydrolase
MEMIDCHAHFIDKRLLRYPVFEQQSAAFESFVGDYSALPRIYRPEDYFADVSGFKVVKIVGAEFMSESPFEEVEWQQRLSSESGYPSGILAVVDFADPKLASTLDRYLSLGLIRAVRQHLAWHPTNPLLRFAFRPDLMRDPNWRGGVALLRNSGLCCELEVFANQLPDFAELANAYPDLQFILPVMGWPTEITEESYHAWKDGMKRVSGCGNVAVKIFGLECIFGLHWTLEQVRPWVLDTIALFGPTRCMFASHMPILKLSRSFQELHSTYWNLVSGFSDSEKRRLFHDTAETIYRL